MSDRRLPVYILLDCSESMIGDGIAGVRAGLDTMLSALRADPMALEASWLSIITFSREAYLTVPLCDLISFQEPPLVLQCGTALGGAFRLLCRSMAADLIPSSADSKGDYRPFVFLITDGQPTDDWRPACEEFCREWSAKCANVYAVGCGDDIDVDVLHTISDIVFYMREMDQERIRRLFFWMTATIQAASKSIGMAKDEKRGLPDIPFDLLDELPPRQHSNGESAPRQIFIRACCSNTGEPYLMRYRKSDNGDFYEAVRSHVLEKSDEEAIKMETPVVDSSELAGIPPCPFCSSQAAIMCECGAILCWNEQKGESMECPSCHKQGIISNEGVTFRIRQSLG